METPLNDGFATNAKRQANDRPNV